MLLMNVVDDDDDYDADDVVQKGKGPARQWSRKARGQKGKEPNLAFRIRGPHYSM